MSTVYQALERQTQTNLKDKTADDNKIMLKYACKSAHVIQSEISMCIHSHQHCLSLSHTHMILNPTQSAVL